MRGNKPKEEGEGGRGEGGERVVEEREGGRIAEETGSGEGWQREGGGKDGRGREGGEGRFRRVGVRAGNISAISNTFILWTFYTTGSAVPHDGNILCILCSNN